MRPLPDLPVFDRAQLRDVGWSDAAVTRAIHARRLRRLRRGLLTAVPTDDGRLSAIAASLACGGSVVSHRSAATLHDLPLLRQPPVPELTVPPRGTGDVSGAHLHRATLRDQDVQVAGQVRVTSVARTVVDLARSLPTADALVAADAALHRGLDPGQIDDVLLTCWNWPGIRRAQRSLALVDARSESPLETVSRLVLGWLRLPAPVPQTNLYDVDGGFLGRADFYWDDLGVVGEADGAMKYDDRDERVREKRRQEALEDAGLIVVRWGWNDVVYHPDRLRERIYRAFDRARRRERSGFPRDWSVRAA